MTKSVLIASIALIGLIGCTDNRSTTSTPERTGSSSSHSGSVTDRTAQTPATTPSTTTAAAMSEADRTLAQQVENSLKQNQQLASATQNIQVHANNGEVTLQGSVNSQQEKTNIGDAARQVAGVTRVNNELEVSSASRS